MTVDGGYRAYRDALAAVVDLPRVRQSEIDAVERRNRDAVTVLTRRRNDSAQQWTSMRETSSRLSRRVNELADRVGVPPVLNDDLKTIAAERLPESIGSLSAELDKAEQAWQWVLRHRDRVVRAGAPTVVPPSVARPVAEPIVAAPPEQSSSKLNPVVVIALIAVVAALVVLVIVMVG